MSVTKIDPDEIPEVPANKFLYRAGSTNNANQKEFRQHYGRDRMRSHRNSGRILKGRGVFVSVLCIPICLIYLIQVDGFTNLSTVSVNVNCST